MDSRTQVEKERCRVPKELRMAKELAVLGIIYNKALISEDEYEMTKKKIMSKYNVVSFESMK